MINTRNSGRLHRGHSNQGVSQQRKPQASQAREPHEQRCGIWVWGKPQAVAGVTRAQKGRWEVWGEKAGWGDVEGEMGEVRYGKEQAFFSEQRRGKCLGDLHFR